MNNLPIQFLVLACGKVKFWEGLAQSDIKASFLNVIGKLRSFYYSWAVLQTLNESEEVNCGWQGSE